MTESLDALGLQGESTVGKCGDGTRVIVKNLPKWATEDQVKRTFSAVGQITDVRLMYTRDGMFRRFAFVGFVSSDDARRAVEHLNRTFMDTSRVEVQMALGKNDQDLSRPWSKYSQGSSLHQAYLDRKKIEEEDSTKADLAASNGASDDLPSKTERKKKSFMSLLDENEETGSDNKLVDFVQAMRPSKRAATSRTWDNDEGKDTGLGEEQAAVVDDDCSTDDEEYQTVLDDADSVEEQLNDNAEESFDDVDDEGHLENGDGDFDSKVIDEHRDRTAELIMDTGRLFLRNLPFTCTEQDLTALFEPFGTLVEVHLSLSRQTRQPKGFGYVQFMIPEQALQAYIQLDGSHFQGRIMHILPAEEKLQKSMSTGKDQSTTSFKAAKDAQMKADASKSYNWNTLFMRADTVLDAISARLGVSKHQLMSSDHSEEGSAATRLAVAETTLVEETRKYLEDAGVVLESFDGQGKRVRSANVILVKNLSYQVQLEEIQKLFAPFGTLGRVILPPTHAVALVEFVEETDARNAFKSLAYSRFHDVPLYLEWAPVGSLRAKVSSSPAVDESNASVAAVENTCFDGLADTEKSAIAGAVLYVKNLNFVTTEEALQSVFQSCCAVESVRIARKGSSANGKSPRSLGFGFVYLKSKRDAHRAIDQLQGVMLDGHGLVISMSSSAEKSKSSSDSLASNSKHTTTARGNDLAKNSENESSSSGSNNTKLIVRNVPFEATEKEVRALFRSFAQLKSVRLPRRFDGRHRGFAFVAFMTHSEAKNAMRVLSSTHLYGRRLVLEWAEEGDTANPESGSAALDALRAKTTSAAVAASAAGSSKISVQVDSDASDSDDYE